MEELRRAYHDRIADLHALTVGILDDAARLDVEPDINGRLADVEREVLDLLAQQAPVARDLRVILAALRIAQIGELCLGLDAMLRDRRPAVDGVLPSSLQGRVGEISRECGALLQMAADAWRVIDDGRAGEIILRSGTSRNLQAQFLAELIGVVSVPIEAAVDLGMLARAYERLTDHAVEIAERVTFAATGGYRARSSTPPSTTSPNP